jgi:hypothetical protein
MGASLMARRDMLEEIGTLDEDYFMFGEEIDFSYRAHEAGWKVVYLPTADVIHIGGGSTGDTSHRKVLIYRGKLTYFRKNLGIIKFLLLYLAIVVSVIIKIAVYKILSLLSSGENNKDQFWVEVLRLLLIRSKE